MGKKVQIWGGYHFWFPQKIYNPSNFEELREIIAEAKKQGLKIRSVGTLHSLNALCRTNEIQVFTDKLNRVLYLDKENLKVKVQGGIKIKQLLYFLAKEHLTLPNQGYIYEQSVAGAIATATHGSGKTGTLSSFVEEMEIIDAFGRLHTLSPKERPDLFSAAVVHLGSLGFIYSVTLRCIHLEKLHLTRVKYQLDEVLHKYPEFLQTYEYFQFGINPYNNDVLCYFYKKTHDPLSSRWLLQLKWLISKGLAVFNFDIFPIPDRLMPPLIKLYMHISSIHSCVQYSHILLSPSDNGHYMETEISLPRENFEKGLSLTREIINKYAAQNKMIIAIILIRFAEEDPYGDLSTTAGGKRVYISLIAIRKPGWEELLKEFETSLYALDGRPHWGKVHHLTFEKISRLYGEGFKNFLESRRKLDPEGLFSNDYVNEFLNAK